MKVRLTKSEQKILDGGEGKISQTAMQIVVALGRIFGAGNLLPIKSAQVAGVSYKNIGGAGLEFLQDWARQAKVRVPTTLNPAGVDLENWEGLADREFAEKQLAVVDAYTKMGIQPTCTCTPYYAGNVPSKGDHIAWSESSAVVYANSVLGACTNREGGVSALAAAIVGKTANYGLHLKENRKPTIQVNVEPKLFDSSDYSAVGYCIGTKLRGIPSINFNQAPKNLHLKALSAGLAANGSVAMFVLGEGKKLKKMTVTEKDLVNTYKLFTSDLEFDMVCLGCPHLSIDEVGRIVRTIQNKKVKVPLLLFTSRKVWHDSFNRGYIDILRRTGARLVADTCMVVSPIKAKSVLTNSAKAAHYLSSFGIKAELGYTDECIKYALGGKHEGKG